MLPAVNAAYRDAVIVAESTRQIPVPNMPAGDLVRLIEYLNDGGGIEDSQAVYGRLRQAIADRNQPAFWRLLFLLLKAYRKQNPFL